MDDIRHARAHRLDEYRASVSKLVHGELLHDPDGGVSDWQRQRILRQTMSPASQEKLVKPSRRKEFRVPANP